MWTYPHFGPFFSRNIHTEWQLYTFSKYTVTLNPLHEISLKSVIFIYFYSFILFGKKLFVK